MEKKRLLLTTIILIFLIFTSYNISVFLIHYHYNEVSSLNEDIEEVMEMIKDNPEAVKKLEDINNEIKFFNSFFFDKVIEDVEDAND